MKYLSIISISLLLLSCANIGTLGGGPVDDKPPVLLKSNLTKLNFNSKTIVLEFDEFINVENVERNIIIVPKQSNYKVKSNNKKVLIELDSFPKNNITYNLIINGGIVDNNASNKFTYNTIYSSDDNIDTSCIIINCLNSSEYKNIKICINKNEGLDSFKIFNTEYMLPVTSNEIRYKGIKDGIYNLWVYTDKNNDNKPDLYEPINFITNIKKDSVYNINLENWKKPFKIKKIIYDESFKYLKLNYDKEDNLSLIMSNIRIDSSDIILLDPEFLIAKNNIKYKNLIIDTSSKFNFKTELKNYILNSIQIFKIRNNYTVQYKIPFDPNNYGINHHLNLIRRTLNTKPDTFIVLNKIFSLQDTFDLKIKNINEEQKLSHLNLLINDTLIRSYDIKIIKNNKYLKTIYNVNLLDEYFEPDVYKFEIYTHNYENNFNPINMKKNTLPIYEKVLYLKASWDEKLLIKIN